MHLKDDFWQIAYYCDIPQYSNVFYYIKHKWRAVYINNQKNVAFDLQVGDLHHDYNSIGLFTIAFRSSKPCVMWNQHAPVIPSFWFVLLHLKNIHNTEIKSK